MPLDILGTVEMHDLIEQWTEEFDRVILDGPPLLGLADVRVVSRFADGMVLAVDAGRHQAQTLVRVRELCEQEGLGAIGVIFNRSNSKIDVVRSMRTANNRRGKASMNPYRTASVRQAVEPEEVESDPAASVA